MPYKLVGTPSASSTGAAGPASFAVDGNQSTRWESQHGIDPSWLALDLGGTFALSRLAIYWEAANPATYRVEGSRDGASWTTIESMTGGQFGDRVDKVPLSGSYRYVRIFCQTRSAGNNWGYSIWEADLFGAPALDTDQDGVDDAADQCPNTPAGDVVNNQGCTVVDTDQDGIEDALDQCPNTPPGATVDAQGCIVVIPVQEVSFAGDILVAGPGALQPGHTLYVSDQDLATPGASSCNGACAQAWPPLLVEDGAPSGVPGLSSIPRSDGTQQVTFQGRPLYLFAADISAGDRNGEGVAGIWFSVPYTPSIVPLFNGATPLEPELQVDTPAALITRLSDRARDRHAREDQFAIYDHYLSFYWEHRTTAIEIVDTVGKGGNTITFNVASQWRLNPSQAELRFFYRGIGTVAEYFDNGIMTSVPSLDDPSSNVRHYTRSVSFNPKTGSALRVGDRMEFELSQFLSGVPNGRNNYYGTAILYIVGQGVVPWEARGVFGDGSTEREDSYPMPIEGWLGGGVTLPYQYSNEPDKRFMQMAPNLSNINGQKFVLGRRVHHTDFGNGSHDESTANPAFSELAGTLGPRYGNRSCVSCHDGNGRALAPGLGEPLNQYVVRVGNGSGGADPNLGHVLQGLSTDGPPEGSASIVSWNESGGLRSPNVQFNGPTPAAFSLRVAPQLVGMGLLESIVESDVLALADPTDATGDGISGRIRMVPDLLTGDARLGRFGWKAAEPTVRHQMAAALNTDIGVMTSMRPLPDRGPLQTPSGSSGAELDDEQLDRLTAYVALLGVSARRDLDDPQALAGEALFSSLNCTACHTPTFQTSAFHPHAELRNQTIHPYTDLLLHDMGPGLASTLDEDGASGAEWRTAPLWNIGLTAGVSGGEGYLHDGRARTLEEAIRWHGGEGEAAKQAYMALTPGDRAAVIAFLQSL